MNISKTRIDISELSDDTSEHSEAVDDENQDNIGQDLSSGPPRYMDNSMQTRAKTFLRFLKGIADDGELIRILAIAFFMISLFTCSIFIIVAEMIALYHGTQDYKMMMFILAMTFIICIADTCIAEPRRMGSGGCGYRCRCG